MPLPVRRSGAPKSLLAARWHVRSPAGLRPTVCRPSCLEVALQRAADEAARLGRRSAKAPSGPLLRSPQHHATLELNAAPTCSLPPTRETPLSQAASSLTPKLKDVRQKVGVAGGKSNAARFGASISPLWLVFSKFQAIRRSFMPVARPQAASRGGGSLPWRLSVVATVGEACKWQGIWCEKRAPAEVVSRWQVSRARVVTEWAALDD